MRANLPNDDSAQCNSCIFLTNLKHICSSGSFYSCMISGFFVFKEEGFDFYIPNMSDCEGYRRKDLIFYMKEVLEKDNKE